MPTPQTIVKALMTPVGIAGSFMTLMGLGLVPVDQKVVGIAAPFLTAFGIPFRPFAVVLGSCKILGAMSLWGTGPMPEWFARIGLGFASVCAVYGHHSIGDSVVGPVVYLGLIGSLYALDSSEKGKKRVN
eukprot:CAMPEP_0172402942 /NCGR_PEP_ID=MMETSP1061-20121228/56935_1 /TAXON_ID=37318 /ORGANISM="Pseudo-nitzschia pungens, Strain cf. pungens" /LENGTH=129 /DNA_ID=CAMNT_0013137127 /DNA_START=84 /DNA_END=473 /DNA_ORIENTATION=-